MAAPEYTIQIPEPCQQNWQQMLPEQKGRRCTHCAKTVIDFTTMTDAQIIEHLEKSSGKLCGRFNAPQLNHPITVSEPMGYPRRKLKEFLAATFLLLTAGKQLKAQDAFKAPDAAIVYRYVYKNEAPDVEASKNRVTKQFLTGQILDSATHEPVMAFISIKNTSTGTTADVDGNFKIGTALGDTLQIKYLGYKDITMRVNDFANRKYYIASRNDYVTTGVIVTVKKPSLKSRIRRFFHLHTRKRN